MTPKENKKPDNPFAFLREDYQGDYKGMGQSGMTLRDYFANSAMQSLIIKTTERKLSIWHKILIYLGLDGWTVNYELSQKNISIASYDIADAMLKQREI